MDKFKNKFRIETTRLKGWDYCNNGAYFITICTQNWQQFFGEIYNGEMQLSKIGEIADKYWKEIPNHFPSIILDNYVIMPNHVHGVLIISESNRSFNPATVETLHATSKSEPTQENDNFDKSKNKKLSDISPKAGSISTIIRSYKSAVTKHARMINKRFGWQARFHDHIIRNNKSYDKIINYIETNPYYWKDDKFYN